MELQNLPWYGQLAVFLLIGGIAFGIFYFVHYSDTQLRIKGTIVQIDKLDKEIRGLEKKKDKIQQMQEEVKKKEETLEKLKEILPEKNEISQNLKKIQAIITTAKLDIQAWNNKAEVNRQFHTEVPFEIKLEGNYHNLAMFFDQLSKLKKIFTVSNLRLAPRAPMTRAFSITASFLTSTYIFRETKKKGGK